MNLMEAFVKIGCDTSDLESGLDSIGGKLSSGLGTIAKAGAAAVGAATGAFVGFTKQAVDVGAAFDASMSNVAAISGATADEFDQLRDKAREMGANTKYSASEAADAMSYMAMAGWKTEDMLDGIGGLMNLAAASGEDLANTSDIVTDALTAFGEGADQAGRLADIMAAASSNANTNVHLMGETFKYVAPLAGSMGYGMEDTAVAIGLMANAGIKGSQAGTALRSIITRLAKPTKDSMTAMNALGISLEDGSGNMYSFMQVMEQMRDGFHDKLMIPEEEFQASLEELNQKLEDGTMTQKQYDTALEELTERAYGAEGAMMAQYAAMLGGQEAMSGLLAIVNASEEDFNKLTTAVDKSKGAAEEMSGTMQDNLAGDMDKLKSAIQEAQISLADQLMPTLRMFAQTATESVGTATQKLNEYLASDAMQEQMQKITDAISRVIDVTVNNLDPILNVVVGVIDGVATGIAFLADNFDMIVEVVKLATAAFVGLQALNLVSTISGIVGAISTAASTVGSLGAAIGAVANPVGLVVAAVAAAAVLIVTHWEEIKNAFSAAWDAIKKAFSSAWDAIKNVWSGATTFFGNVVKSIVNAFTNLPQTIRTIGQNIMEGLGNGLMDRLQSVVDKARNVASSILGAVKGFFGISSPSKVMRYEVGQQIGEGAVLGIEDKFAKIKGTMADMGDIVTGSSVGSGVPVQGGSNARIEQLLMTIIDNMQRFGVTIDGKVLAGYLAPVIDDYLGTVVDNLQREAVTV